MHRVSTALRLPREINERLDREAESREVSIQSSDVLGSGILPERLKPLIRRKSHQANDRTAKLSEDLAETNLDLVEPDPQSGKRPKRLDIVRDTQFQLKRCLAIINYVEEAFKPIINAGRRPALLEVGAGYLYVTTALRRALGLSFELYAIEHPARRYLNLEGFERRVGEQQIKFQTADIISDQVPWSETTFDVIVLAEVIEHLPPTDLPGVLEKLASRLSKGGCLILSSPNLPALYRIASLAFGRGEIFNPPLPLAYAPETYGHIRLYGKADLLTLMDYAKLKIDKWTYLNWEVGYVPHSAWSQRVAYAGQLTIPRALPHLSTSWMCSAKPKS